MFLTLLLVSFLANILLVVKIATMKNRQGANIRYYARMLDSKDKALVLAREHCDLLERKLAGEEPTQVTQRP